MNEDVLQSGKDAFPIDIEVLPEQVLLQLSELPEKDIDPSKIPELIELAPKESEQEQTAFWNNVVQTANAVSILRHPDSEDEEREEPRTVGDYHKALCQIYNSKTDRELKDPAYANSYGDSLKLFCKVTVPEVTNWFFAYNETARAIWNHNIRIQRIPSGLGKLAVQEIQENKDYAFGEEQRAIEQVENFLKIQFKSYPLAEIPLEDAETIRTSDVREP